MNLDKRNPVAATAEAHDKTASQVRDLLHEARRRKLLTRTERGVAGGQLTDKGRQALERVQEEN